MAQPSASRLLRSLVLLPPLLAFVACGAASGDDRGAAPGQGAQQTPARQEDPGRRTAPLPRTAWVILGSDTVVAEVARSAQERAEGLMYREEVPDGTGMLFVFESPAVRSFWMENTFVALDIAYIDESLRITDIQRMEPETSDLHESDGPALFALEVRAGWFEEHGVSEGDTVEIVFGG